MHCNCSNTEGPQQIEESNWYRNSSGSDHRHCKRCLNCSSAEGRRNGTVPVAETTGGSTSKALQQTEAIAALGSYDGSRYLQCWRTATGLNVGTGLTVIAGALTVLTWSDGESKATTDRIVLNETTDHWTSWKENTIVRSTRESNRSLSIPSLTALKVESFD